MKAGASVFVLLALASTAEAQPRAQVVRPLSGSRRLAMRNCPSAVPTASTVATPTRDGIDVDVASTQPDARKRILALAQMQTHLGDLSGALPPHTGMRSGGAAIGFCPTVHANTLVTSEPISDGVRFHLRARDPHQVQVLQQDTQARIAALQQRRTSS